MCNIGWEMREALEEIFGETTNYYSDFCDRGYKVIPKKETYTKAAKYLSDIMDIFEQDVCYNS